MLNETLSILLLFVPFPFLTHHPLLFFLHSSSVISLFLTTCIVLASCSTVNTDDLMTTMGGGSGGGPHDFDNVVLTASNSGNVLDSLQHNKEWDAAPLFRRAGITTSIAFGGKSRYLCLGDTSGAVCLWDLKKRTRARQFFLPQNNSNNNGSTYNPANQVMLDPLDRYVLSLSPSLFSVFNLREGTLATSITPPSNNYNYTKFCMSQIEPHVAAIGTKDGSILLYDIATAAAMNNKNNIHRQSSPAMPFSTLDRCHESTITGIAISRTNPQLLASSSLDGTLNFIDIKSNELIHGEIVSNNNINSSNQGSGYSCSITCLSLHSDGISCAVGTNTGNILVYDIRKVNGVVASLSVQDSVTSIQYALPHKSSSSSSKASSTPVRPTTSTTPGGSITPGGESRQQQSNHQTQPHYDSNTMDQSNKTDIGRNVFESDRGQQQHDPTMTGMRGAIATTTMETGTTGGTVRTEYQSTAKFSYQGPDDDKLQQNQQQSSQQQTPMIASRQQGQSEPSLPPRIDMVRTLLPFAWIRFDYLPGCLDCFCLVLVILMFLVFLLPLFLLSLECFSYERVKSVMSCVMKSIICETT